ncbi:MAG: flagellar biosynthetic protein FliO [Nitrospira sp.]|nr:flagellar biosynthetic protein FliO [Nitrospira sp.]
MVDFWDSFFRMASALILVLALIAGLVALIRRFGGPRFFAPGTAPVVQVLGSGYLGPRKTISLVAVAGELLIVGVTPTELVSFGRVTDPEQIRQVHAKLAAGAPPASGEMKGDHVAE